MLNYSIIDNWGIVLAEGMHHWHEVLSKVSDMGEDADIDYILIEDTEDGTRYYADADNVGKVEELKNILNKSKYIDDLEIEQIKRELGEFEI